MRAFLCGVLLVGVLAGLCPAALRAGKPATRPATPRRALFLDGRWKVVKLQDGPSQAGPDKFKDIEVIIYHTALNFKRSGKPGGFLSIHLEKDRVSGHVEVICHHYHQVIPGLWVRKATMPGLYSLEGDRLTICFSPAANARRPAKIGPGSKPRVVVLVLERKQDGPRPGK